MTGNARHRPAPGISATTTAPPYRDAARPLEERLEDLLARMTLPEKVGQMLQLDARDDLQDVVATKLAGSILHASPERMLAAIELAAATRLGTPPRRRYAGACSTRRTSTTPYAVFCG